MSGLHRLPANVAVRFLPSHRVPVNDRPRIHGKSKYGISRTFKVFLDLIGVIFVLTYFNRPMRVFGGAGMVTGGIGALMLLYLSYEKIILGHNIGERPPLPLMAVVRRLEAIESGAIDTPPAAVRLTALNGTVVSVHAARLLDGSGNGPVALTLTPAASVERSSLLLAAYGLTPAQRRVAELVLLGRTTGQIVVELHISAHTVQDHLKVVFDKIGVRSRRELVGTLLWRTTG